jgi:hypothetical protein
VIAQSAGILIVMVPVMGWPGMVKVRCDVGVGVGVGDRLVEEVLVCVLGAGAALEVRGGRGAWLDDVRDPVGCRLAEVEGCAEDDARADVAELEAAALDFAATVASRPSGAGLVAGADDDEPTMRTATMTAARTPAAMPAAVSAVRPKLGSSSWWRAIRTSIPG